MFAAVISAQQAPAPLTRADFRSLVWVLELDWSTPLRWASESLTATDENGESVRLRGGLEVSFKESVEWFGEVPGEREASFSGLRVPHSLNIGSLVELGHALAGVQGILSAWVPSRSWESRVTLIRGTVRTPSAGGIEEPISLTLRAVRRTDLPKQPLPSERVSVDTWPALDSLNEIALPEDSDGVYYPIVYGRPGFREARPRRIFIPGVNFGLRPDTFSHGGGSPCTLVFVDYDLTAKEDTIPGEDAKILGLILNGSDYDPVDFETGVFGLNKVSILNVTKDERWDDRNTIVEGGGDAIDALGQRTTIVDLTDRFIRLADPWVVGDELWCLWDESFWGSTPADRHDGLLQGAGDVIEWTLRRGGATVDTAGWEGVREELNPFLIDTYRDKPEDAWDWVASELLPLLPVGVVDDVNGLSPVLWRWDVNEQDTAGHIVEGRLGVERMGQPIAEPDWSNAIRVNYQPRTSGKAFESLIAIVGETLVSDTQHPTTQTMSSNSRFGEREARVVDALAVNDPTTASRMASWMAAAFSAPRVKVKLRDKQLSWAHVAVGLPVLYSDAELGWERRIVWVTSRTWDGRHPTLTLLAIPDPVLEA